MNSPVARVVKVVLRLQRPLLRRVQHPAQLRPLEKLLALAPQLPAGARRQRLSAGGVPVLVVRNQRPDAEADRYLVYVHGGGFASGSPDTHAGFAARLMQVGRFSAVFMPTYRRAPAHAWPAALDDVQACWEALQAAHPGATMALAGESAGANLCLAMCLRLRDGGMPLPCRVYVHSPWLDVSLSGPSYTDSALEDGFTGRRKSRRDWIHQVFARHYVAHHDPRHPHISPVFGALQGLPPLYVQTGAKELFLDDSRLLKQRCDSAGVSCRLEVWPGMWHGFALFAPVPEARRAIGQAGRWLAGNAD
ncbi:MAG: alpha/beta hydrolase [Moraxellaceae bacterium]